MLHFHYAFTKFVLLVACVILYYNSTHTYLCFFFSSRPSTLAKGFTLRWTRLNTEIFTISNKDSHLKIALNSNSLYSFADNEGERKKGYFKQHVPIKYNDTVKRYLYWLWYCSILVGAIWYIEFLICWIFIIFHDYILVKGLLPARQ